MRGMKQTILVLIVAVMGAYFMYAGCGGTATTTGSGGSGGSGTGGTGGSGTGGSGTAGTGGSATVTSRGSGAPATDTTISYTGTLPDSTSWFTPSVLTIAGRPARTSLDQFKIYRPPTNNTNLPLILVFPGTGDSTTKIVDDMGGEDSIVAALAATEQAIIIAVPNTTNAADWDHPSDMLFFNTVTDNETTNTDLLLVRATIKEAIRAYSINPSRVYTMGFSNGAFFSIFTAFTMPTRIAGFAERSGGWAKCLPGGIKYEPAFTSADSNCTGLTPSSTSCTCDILLTEAAGDSHFSCTSSPTEPFSTLPTGVNRVPGYISHDPQDNSVSVYYSCSLYSAMNSASFSVSAPDLRHVSDDDGGRHGVIVDFFSNAWNFLRTKSL